ncbi:hypothetical protein TWF173_006869 [Orbilia oligospora]|uniref:LysM domain-containing protein n=1 Tax=Orbilia oligospora TaxID=2813651 RepID=A0A7C8R5Y8_ORBOL|nr:hypothetical protein TWF970_008978 [Orbilia oligospora]KAF3312840.1 hypothetical protein TWF173_006869 [Orbilia oligospora]
MDETLTSTPPPSASCSTCQTLLHKVQLSSAQELNEKLHSFDEKDTEKRTSALHYKSECCGRYVCFLCISKNPRFITYCPFCPIKRPKGNQETDTEIKLEPPSYTLSNIPPSPPPYSTDPPETINSSNSLFHYLLPNDSLVSISFQYSIPSQIIRSYNRLYSDSLLAGRNHILIPRAYYSGPSLSPSPVQSEEGNVLKRFQIRTKCVEYDIAKVYLDESAWDLEKAIEKWTADERWESLNGGMSSRVRAGKARPSNTGSLGLRKGFLR